MVPCTRGHLNDIIKVNTERAVGPRVPSHQLFRYVTGGPSQAFWEYVNSSDFDALQSVSQPCKQSLITVKNGLDASSITAFKFVDSAGKSPPGFMRAAVSSFGDFDQCLSIHDTMDGVPLIGKYCAYDTYPLKNSPVNESIFSLDGVGVFQGAPYINSICVPSQCSTMETSLLLSKGKSTLFDEKYDLLTY